MKLQTFILGIIISATACGCAHHVPVPVTYNVTLSDDTFVYHGVLTFDLNSEYTGTLVVKDGPGGESFTGAYAAVETTAEAVETRGIFRIPVAHANATILTQGTWVGEGSHGSILRATLQVGKDGHGIGMAKLSNGKEYQIAF